jgi:hypothetical protein
MPINTVVHVSYIYQVTVQLRKFSAIPRQEGTKREIPYVVLPKKGTGIRNETENLILLKNIYTSLYPS